MTIIRSVTLEVPDPVAANAFYSAAFDLGSRVGVRATEAPTTGFRGFTMSLVVSQPSTVDSLVGSALEAGAEEVKPVSKSFWGYGGVVRAPDGTLWKVASSSKKDTGPASRQIDAIVLLLGAEDVAVSRRFYVEHGLTVARSFGRKYVEFAAPAPSLGLALLGRRALAKDAGVPAGGTGSHRIAICAEPDSFAGSARDSFTDPDGFGWEAARTARGSATPA